MDKSTQSRRQPKAPETSAIKGVKENIDKKIERRTEKKEKEHTEPETHTEIESRSDVVISYPETGEIKYDVHGRGAKTKEQLKREYDQIGKKYKKMMNLGGKRTRKRKRRRKRKTRKRKRRRTKKKRKSRRRKRRRTRK